MKVPITKAVLGTEELALLKQTLDSGWLVQGPRVREFENAFTQYTGAPHAIAVTSCTTALHLALVALGIGPGDEVLVPSFTWIATANAVEYVGAKPIFVDIDLRSYNIDFAAAEAACRKRTRAIIPVHLFGLACDVPALKKLARRKNLKVIEDAACGFGSRFNGQHVGNFGDAGCFSFHPRKAITTGEGGMITVAKDKQATLLRSLRDHGATVSDLARHGAKGAYILPEFPHLGYNFRMTDLQGAVGVAQMAKAQEIQAQRVARAKRYDDLLHACPELVLPLRSPGYDHAFQSYVCLFQPEPIHGKNIKRLHALRNKVMMALEQDEIATRPGTHAPVTLKYYKQKYKLKAEDFPKAIAAQALTITLPLYAAMTDAEQDYVVHALHAALRSL